MDDGSLDSVHLIPADFLAHDVFCTLFLLIPRFDAFELHILLCLQLACHHWQLLPLPLQSHLSFSLFLFLQCLVNRFHTLLVPQEILFLDLLYFLCFNACLVDLLEHPLLNVLELADSIPNQVCVVLDLLSLNVNIPELVWLVGLDCARRVEHSLHTPWCFTLSIDHLELFKTVRLQIFLLQTLSEPRYWPFYRARGNFCLKLTGKSLFGV